MITILNISDTKFSYNGIAYFKNFTPFVTGNKVSIVNTYDACISLTNFPTIYSDISVDGVTYGSVSALQNALLPVLFNRTFTQAGSLAIGFIPKSTGSNSLGNSLIYESSGGKIGINTTIPLAKMTIRGGNLGNTVSMASTVFSVQGNDQGIFMGAYNGTPSYGSWIQATRESFDLFFNLSLQPNGGNFGVGTANPVYKFHVNDTTDGIVGHFSGGVSNYTLISFKSNEANVYSTSLGSYNSGMLFRTGATDRMYINPSGNVGIGTTSPNSYGAGFIGLTLDGSTTSFVTARANGVNKITLSANGGGGTPVIQANDVTTALGFQVGGSERMRITSGGHLLVGTTTSLYGNSTRGNIELNGSVSSLLALKINDTIGCYLYTSNVNSELYSTLPLTFAVNGLERMRISSEGNIGLGTTNPINGGGAARWITTEGTTNYSGGLVASINGNAKAYFYSQDDYAIVQGSSGQGVKLMPNGVNGLIIYSNTNYQFTGSNVSDKRAKTKIQDLQINSLEKIMALKSKSYYMKNDPTKIKYGFIAQDVNEILPDLINGDLNGEDFIGLDYIGIIPILTNAIQELKAEIEILKN